MAREEEIRAWQWLGQWGWPVNALHLRVLRSTHFVRTWAGSWQDLDLTCLEEWEAQMAAIKLGATINSLGAPPHLGVAEYVFFLPFLSLHLLCRARFLSFSIFNKCKTLLTFKICFDQLFVQDMKNLETTCRRRSQHSRPGDSSLKWAASFIGWCTPSRFVLVCSVIFTQQGNHLRMHFSEHFLLLMHDCSLTEWDEMSVWDEKPVACWWWYRGATGALTLLMGEWNGVVI